MVIIDYGVGNLDSVMRGLKRVGIEAKISESIDDIQSAEALVLPGVGAFGPAMEKLKHTGYIPIILNHVKQNKPLLGICLGMQLLYEKSFERGEYEGLGILQGVIRYLDVHLNIPHMGWNSLVFNQEEHPLLKYINEGDYVYFVHSYAVDSPQSQWVAYTEYGIKVPAIVAKGSVYATQFHPEKSGQVGLQILKAFKEAIV